MTSNGEKGRVPVHIQRVTKTAICVYGRSISYYVTPKCHRRNELTSSCRHSKKIPPLKHHPDLNQKPMT